MLGLKREQDGQAVEAAVRNVPGVRNIHANAGSGIVTVEYDPQRTTPVALAEALRSAGFRTGGAQTRIGIEGLRCAQCPALRRECRDAMALGAALSHGRAGGIAAQTVRAPNGAFKVSLQIQLLIVAVRRLLGRNEKHIAAELAQRDIAQVSHTTVGRIFARYHLPTRTYCSSAKRASLRYRRYEQAGPNQQWHIDFTETYLADGTAVVVIVLTADYSHYCLRCRIVPAMTAEGALAIVQEAWQE